jgi:hypothetical protein
MSVPPVLKLLRCFIFGCVSVRIKELKSKRAFIFFSRAITGPVPVLNSFYFLFLF